jgi:hypothetical protein
MSPLNNLFIPGILPETWMHLERSGIAAGAQFESSHLNYRNGGMETRFAESHAAAVKHNVITIEKAMGRIKRYLQLTTVMAAKQSANAHAVPRMSAKVAVGSPPSCHAKIAANR